MSMRDTEKFFDAWQLRLADGDIKLIDTGGGEEDRKKVHWFDGEFTRETDVASPIYFAPELKEFVTGEREKVEIKPYKADIWSMGMVAVALLSGEENMLKIGRAPRTMKRLMEKGINSQDDAVAFVHTIFPFTTTGEWRTPSYKMWQARNFVNAALRFNPDERPTVEELLKMPFVA